MSRVSACLNFFHFQPQMCLNFIHFQPQMCLFSQRNLFYRYNYFYLKLWYKSVIVLKITLTANIMVLIEKTVSALIIRKWKKTKKEEKKREKRKKNKFWPNLSLGACLAMCLFFEETEPSVLINCVLTKKISVIQNE